MKKFFVGILLLTILSCSKDEKPLTNNSELKEFTVEATTGFNPVKTFIDNENGLVQVFTDSNLADLSFPLTLKIDMKIPEGATSEPASGATVTFADPEDFKIVKITSGDMTITNEYLFTIRDRQIPNAGFESWFQETGMNSVPFPQPGKYRESTVWATANMGTSIYSIYGTVPLIDGDNTLIKIETVETVGIPIVAGALYIGSFDINSAMKDPTNPVAAAKLGMPFFERPKSVKFKYSYTPGNQMIQATPKQPGNMFGGFNITNLDGKDKFGVEVALEKRAGENVTVVAKTNFQSDEATTGLTELTLPVNYLTNDTPTHFYISFSPSFDGGTFKGAIGSTLIIDDIELIYE